jgi:collagenase-like PrtC family protease
VVLDVPLIADPDYIDFLKGRVESLHSLYFRLPGERVLDSRYRFWIEEETALTEALSILVGPGKYALLNSRFYRPDVYDDSKLLSETVSQLMRIKTAAGLDGVIFSDFYFLRALVDRGEASLESLEAVPSVNGHLDRYPKIRRVFDRIAELGFRPPRRVILDRSLNRRPQELRSLTSCLRKAYPGIQIGLLANEGCMADCPFKPAHDAHIAMGNMNVTAENTHALNRDLGCIRLFWARPELIFSSPLIRPEDAKRYDGLVDFLKLSGRTLGGRFLENAIEAYDRCRYEGNLLDLSDTLEALAGRIYIPNHQLPADFWERSCRCPDQCDTCGFCSEMAETHLKRVPAVFHPMVRRSDAGSGF